MEYVLKNETITLTVSDQGAEILSLVKGGREYIWHGDPRFWGRRTPVLFPFVGQVRGGSYRYQGVEYPMGQHGFARDQVFALKGQTEDSLSFVLHENENTLKVYPFCFELTITYTLFENGVTVEWLVKNTGGEMLHFSIGGHPAFMCPIDGEGEWKDYKILLKKGGAPLASMTIHPITSGGNVGPDYKDIPLEDGMITPTDELFAGDALILEGKQADEVALVDPKGSAYLTVCFDMPLVGIWSPVGKHAPFICIEPWCGRTDSVDFAGSLEEREYGNALGVGEEFRKDYRILV